MNAVLLAALIISPALKQQVFEEISNLVFFEDEGFVRAPQSVSDFNFKSIGNNRFSVTGNSYSDWDMKEISYDCTAEVSEAKLLALTCSLENENWPYMD